MGKKSKAKRQRRQNSPIVVTPPPEIAAAIDRMSQSDREWFERHPGAEERIRLAAPHEFWPNFDSAVVRYVIVRQVRPGFRLRFPIVRLHRPETERVQ
jgi:hypothetical protein